MNFLLQYYKNMAKKGNYPYLENIQEMEENLVVYFYI